MAALERRPSRSQSIDPSLVETAGISMTPALQAVHSLAKLAYDLEKARDVLDELLLDATELSLAEGHLQRTIVHLQGQNSATWRTHFAKVLLRERGIGLRKGRREQPDSADLAPEDLPAYLDASVTESLATTVKALIEKINKVEQDREKLYPDLHTRAEAAIQERLAA